MPEIDNPITTFFYWYSKLFIININRKRFELISDDERLWAINNSRNTIFAILFSGFGSIYLFSGLIELSNSNTKITTGFILLFVVLFPIIGAFSFRQFLWLVNGKQELIVEHGNLILRKRGTYFTSENVYPLKSIKNIRKAIDQEQLSMAEKTMFRFSISRKVGTTQVFGEILFDYQYNTIKVFNDLDNQEKEELIKELLKRQEKLLQN